MIFDKHAAHERVIFERLKSGAAKQYQQLLMQKTETLLPMDEFALMQEQTEQLANMGFSFDFSNPPFLRTTAVPTFLQSLNIDEIVTEIAHNFALGKINPQTAYLDDLLHTMACKAAIKAHDKNDLAELQELAQMLQADSGQESTETESAPTAAEQTDAAASGGGLDLGALMKVSQLMGSAKEDSDAALLLALKPHLREERQKKVEKAVKMLKLLSIWSMLKESGMLKDFL